MCVIFITEVHIINVRQVGNQMQDVRFKVYDYFSASFLQYSMYIVLSNISNKSILFVCIYPHIAYVILGLDFQLTADTDLL